MKLSLFVTLSALIISAVSAQNYGSRAVKEGGRCGAKFGNAVCGSGLCCSTVGYCGKTANHCDVGKCQSKFGTCKSSSSTVGEGGKCGTKNGNKSCGSGLCCSVYGFCGKTSNHCSASQCQKSFGKCNTAPTSPSTASEGQKCGANNGNKSCSTGLCCSIYGFCGKTSNHCSASHCQKTFGSCNKPTSTTTKKPPTYTTTKKPVPTTAPPASGSWWKPAAYPITWQIQYPGTLNMAKIQSAVSKHKLTVMNVDLFDVTASQISQMHSMGIKVVCYFSAGSYEDWRPDIKDFPSSIRAATYDGWDGEWWLDLYGFGDGEGGSSPLKSIMTKRIQMAKTKKCDAVDPDNVDSYTNNVGNTYSQQLNYNKWLASTAHATGLAISLKNDPEQIPALLPYFDFAVTEECVEGNMCEEWNPFVKANKPVFAISYNGSCGKLKSLKQNGLLKNLDLDEGAKDCSSGSQIF